MNKRDQMPRRSQFSSEEAYLRARKRKIREIRARKRKLRKIVKNAIVAAMVLCVLLVAIGIGTGVRAIVRSVSARSITKTVLAERFESMPDLSAITLPEETVEPVDLSVCVDPGHGGEDPGTNTDERLEKDDTLNLGLALRDALEARGVEVVMTRDDDTFPSLSERCEIANEADVDYYISIHRNSVDEDVTTDPQGIDIYVPVATKDKAAESYTLAENIMAALEEVGISQSRGVHYGSQSSENYDWEVNRNTTMPSCLIEMGFISNEEDNALLDEHLEEYAEAMADAILKTAGIGTDTASSSLSGLLLTNTVIQDIDALSDEALVWAPGTDTNEDNCPTGAVSYQETYGSYQADFYIEDAQDEIFLTFDTGYEAGYTEQILDKLLEHDITAVFFITLPFAQANPDLVQRMIDEGHIIGNHTAYNPEDGIASLSLEEQEAAITELDDYMEETFQYNMCLFRFPNGRFSEQSLALVNNLDYCSVFWSFSYEDYDTSNQPDQSQALQTMVKHLHNGAIYLLSARSQTNANVLDDFISEVGKAGYTFGVYSVTSTGSAEEADVDDETSDKTDADNTSDVSEE